MGTRCVIGEVALRAVNPGSKSAREAVVLVSNERTWVLRRRGAPSVGDTALLDFVGQRVRAVGTASAGQLICDELSLHEDD